MLSNKDIDYSSVLFCNAWEEFVNDAVVFSINFDDWCIDCSVVCFSG
jgi:hypothetical protein